MRWASSEGRWIVDRIHLSLTGTGRDGEWLRVSEYGYFAVKVRAWEDLARFPFDRGELTALADGLRLRRARGIAAGHRSMFSCVRRGQCPQAALTRTAGATAPTNATHACPPAHRWPACLPRRAPPGYLPHTGRVLAPVSAAAVLSTT